MRSGAHAQIPPRLRRVPAGTRLRFRFRRCMERADTTTLPPPPPPPPVVRIAALPVSRRTSRWVSTSAFAGERTRPDHTSPPPLRPRQRRRHLPCRSTVPTRARRNRGHAAIKRPRLCTGGRPRRPGTARGGARSGHLVVRRVVRGASEWAWTPRLGWPRERRRVHSHAAYMVRATRRGRQRASSVTPWRGGRQRSCQCPCFRIRRRPPHSGRQRGLRTRRRRGGRGWTY